MNAQRNRLLALLALIQIPGPQARVAMVLARTLPEARLAELEPIVMSLLRADERLRQQHRV